MMSRRRSILQRGFTLIELMIIIIVIAILALIIIPRLTIYSRKSKESAMIANLGRIREAIEQFCSDTGDYPATISALYAPAGSNPPGANYYPSGVPNGTYKGPYLKFTNGGINGGSVPRDPMVPSSIVVEETTTAANPPTAHWAYTAATGSVSPGLTGTTSDGINYSLL